MNCEEAHDWLVSAETPAEPSPAVASHLHQCARCLRLQQRVLTLDREIREIPFTPPSAELQDQFLQHLPQRSHSSTKRTVRVRVFALAAAAAVILLMIAGLSFLIDPGSPSATSSNVEQRPDSRLLVSLDGKLVTQLVTRSLTLARQESATNQMRALTEMAVDLRKEILRLADRGNVEDVQLLVELYQGVVSHGIVSRMQRLSVEDRPAITAAVMIHLHDTELLAKQSAEGKRSEVSQRLLAMGNAAQVLNQGLAAKSLPAPAALPRTWSSPGQSHGLVGALVYGGLQLAEETDPLKRADFCTDIADSLAQAMVQVSATDHPDRVVLLSEQMGRVMDGGVGNNLAKIVEADLDQPRKEKLDKVQKRAAKATAKLERVLARAPEPARAGLQRALEVSRGWNKPKFNNGKGKGPGNNKGKGKGKGLGNGKGKGRGLNRNRP